MSTIQQENNLRGTQVGRPGSAALNSMLIVAWFGVVVFTASALIPENFSEAGALQSAAWVATFGIAVVPLAIAIVSRSILVFIRIEVLISVGLVYWILLDLLQGIYPTDGVSESAVYLALAYVSIFAAGLWIGVIARRERLPDFLIQTVVPLSSGLVIRLAIVAFLIGIFPYFYFAGFSVDRVIDAFFVDRWSAPWAREAYGDETAFILHLAYFGYFVPALTVLYATTTRWLRPSSLALIVLSGIVVLFLAQSGGRRTVGGIVLGALVSWVILNHSLSAKRQIAVIVGVAASLLAGLQYMLLTRGEGLLLSSDQLAGTFSISYLRVDDNFYRITQVIDMLPAQHPFVPWEFLTYVLVWPIPRVFWQGKPTGPGFDLAREVGLEGVSLSMSILGELHLIQGLPAVFLGGLCLGLICKMLRPLIDRSIKHRNPITYALLAITAFTGIRAFFDIILGLYVCSAWWLLAYAMSRRARRPRE